MRASKLQKENYNNLDPILPDFRVSDYDYPEYENGINDFIIIWIEKGDIVAQRFDADSHPLRTRFAVDASGSIYSLGYPSLATDGVGNFVVTWEDTRNKKVDVYAQRYSNLGKPLGTNFIINSDASPAIPCPQYSGYPMAANIFAVL